MIQIPNISNYVIPILFIIALGMAYGWVNSHEALKAERTAHQTDVRDFKEAQAEANTKAETERAALQKENDANVEQANQIYSSLDAKYRANLLRLAASQSGGHEPDYSELSPTQGSDGPSTGPEVPGSISISIDDAEVCATNTARLQAVQEWATHQPTQ